MKTNGSYAIVFAEKQLVPNNMRLTRNTLVALCNLRGLHRNMNRNEVNMPDSPFVLLPLSRGQFAKIDPDMESDLSQWSWSVNPTRSGFYAHRQVKTMGKRQKEYMHRRIAGAAEGEYVDHVNGDTLDNRRCNLRVGTQSENMHNARRSSSRPHAGVYRRGDRFVARAKDSGRHLWLGTFKTEAEASAAYDAFKMGIGSERGLNGQRGRI